MSIASGSVNFISLAPSSSTRVLIGSCLRLVLWQGDTANTIDSHRLLAYAEQFGHEKQEALVEELFLLYLTQEKWLSKEVLAAAAQKVGIPNAEDFLQDESAGLSTVKEHLEKAKELEIKSVPSVIIGSSVLSGSQTPEKYEELITAVANGESAGIDFGKDFSAAE